MNVPLRYAAFRFLRSARNLLAFNKSEKAKLLFQPTKPFGHSGYLWVFTSTIGELNAITVFLDELLARTGWSLVLLTDRPQYLDAFNKSRPQAAVIHYPESGDISGMLSKLPPRLFLLSEIPCFLSDGPCRFSYAGIHQIKKAGVPVVMVNGWLYGEKPKCRMDRIEYRLLNRTFVASIDLYLVQTEEVRQKIISLGARSDRIKVTGNCKFDGLERNPPLPDDPDLLELLNAIKTSGRPVLVAGCVTNFQEQELVLDAYCQAKQTYPDFILVIAPRYPEKMDRMDVLTAELDKRHLRFAMRTELTSSAIPTIDVAILNTVGELRFLYAASTISHVGRNHNVLEPLMFNKPVTVWQGWNPTYPSFSVYESTKAADLIYEFNSTNRLAEHFLKLLSERCKIDVSKTISEQLSGLKGAKQLILDYLHEFDFTQKNGKLDK